MKNVNAEINYCKQVVEMDYPSKVHVIDYKALADYINGGETNAELRQIVRDHVSELDTDEASMKCYLKYKNHE